MNWILIDELEFSGEKISGKRQRSRYSPYKGLRGKMYKYIIEFCKGGQGEFGAL